MVRNIGIIAIVLAVAFAGMYFAGWVNFHKQPDAATIEIETGEMKKSADKAIEKGEKLIDKATHKTDSPDRVSP